MSRLIARTVDSIAATNPATRIAAGIAAAAAWAGAAVVIGLPERVGAMFAAVL
jgi:hypothetical protein